MEQLGKCVCVSVIKFVSDDGNIWGSMGISVPQYKVTLSLRHTHTHCLSSHFLPNSPNAYLTFIIATFLSIHTWNNEEHLTSHTLIDTKSSKYNDNVTHCKTFSGWPNPKYYNSVPCLGLILAKSWWNFEGNSVKTQKSLSNQAAQHCESM